MYSSLKTALKLDSVAAHLSKFKTRCLNRASRCSISLSEHGDAQ